MNKLNLQQFAEAIQGKKVAYLYRLLEKSSELDATAMAFVTENTRTTTKDADSTATKDGSIRTPGVEENEISATSILAKGDTFLDDLEDALHNDKILEIWEVNLEEEGTGENAGKFKSVYFQGYLTELEKTSSAEDMVEISLTFGINGTGVPGYATVSKEQQDTMAYVFADTVKSGA